MTIVPNISTSISGDPKTGKTHLALSWPAPIVVFSFDLRGAEILRGKLEFKDKEIEIKKYLPPIADSLKPDPYAKEFWPTVEEDYRKTVESGKFKTVLIDPATMVWEIIRHWWTEVENRKQLITRDYGEPNAKMTWLLTSPLVAGMNVVCTQYLADVYVSDKPTGDKKLDGFKRTEGLVDVVLVTRLDSRSATPTERKELGQEQINVVKTKIWGCRFDMNLVGMELENTNYDEIAALLGLTS